MGLILVESEEFDGFCIISEEDRRMDVKIEQHLPNDSGKQLLRPSLGVNKCDC